MAEYKYFQREFFRIGISIDEIVNSLEAKQKAKSEWKYLCQFRAIEKEWQEREQKKYQTWLEPYMQSIRYFLAHGDRYKIVQFIRKYLKWIVWFFRIPM